VFWLNSFYSRYYPIFLVFLCFVGVLLDYVSSCVGLSMGFVEVGNALFAVEFFGFAGLSLLCYYVDKLITKISWFNSKFVVVLPVVFSFAAFVHNLMVMGGVLV
jgi:hypothetical protein